MEEEAKEDLQGKIVKKDQRGSSRKREQHEEMPLEVKVNRIIYGIVRGRIKLKPKIHGVGVLENSGARGE